MNVTQIAVSIHEKRNHPFEYGHYDCEVRLTAELDSDEDIFDEIVCLREMARGHVLGECEMWQEQIREDHRIEELTYQIKTCLNGVTARWSNWEEQARIASGKIKELPSQLQKEWSDQLAAAVESGRLWRRNLTEPPNDEPEEDNELEEEVPF